MVKLAISVLTGSADAAKAQIELEKVLFTGGVHFNQTTGHVYIPDTPGPKYVGQPGPEIDSAWDDLLEGNRRN